MPLNEEQLALVKSEVIAIAREAQKLPDEEKERRFRFLAMSARTAGLPRSADAAIHIAICVATTSAGVEDFIRTVEAE